LYVAIKKILSTLAFCFSLLFCILGAQAPRVLLMHYRGSLFGGVANDFVNRHQAFLQNGLTSILIVHEGTAIIDRLNEEKLPYVVIPANCRGREPFYAIKGMEEDCFVLAKYIYEYCTRYNLNTVFCVSLEQLRAAQIVKQQLNINVIYIEHNQVDKLFYDKSRLNKPLYIRLQELIGLIHLVDACIGVNSKNKEFLEHSVNWLNSYQRKPLFATIKPFFNEANFLEFTTQETRSAYFKRVHGLDIDDHHPVVTMLASFYTVKRHDLAIKAFIEIYDKLTQIPHLIFAGDGPFMKRMQKMVAELGLGAYIHFVGSVSSPQELLYHSDLHVLSSETETVGLVTIEAALMGKPVIGATATGAEELILNGQTGFLFENNNYQDLAEKIHVLLSDASLRKRMGFEGKLFIQKYCTRNKIYTETRMLMDKLLKQL